MFLGSIICMPDAKQAAERDEMFLSGKAPPPAPFPILTAGLLERDSGGAIVGAAGELAPHGAVRSQGRTGRLDSFTNGGFTLLLSEMLPDNALSDASRTICANQGIDIKTVADRRHATSAQIGDTQGQILKYMTQHGVDALLVRPDFYLFGASSGTPRLNALLANFADQAERHDLSAA